jgi:hypothetical protein
MSTNSTSPIIHSSSSLVADDGYDSPVNDTDEIIHRHHKYFYVDDARGGEFDEYERNSSLWHDLDRDGVNTPAIPSFILNSPPMGPLLSGGVGGVEYEDVMLRLGSAHADVAIHSLRKGIHLEYVGVLTLGYDPKFFFDEGVEARGRGLNVEATSFIPDRDRDSIDPPIGSQYPSASSSRGYRSNTPSPPTTCAPVNDNSLWSSTNDGSASKYIPSQGPWGIIPSRTIMISNLPKTTQLWTLVELLKVPPSSPQKPVDIDG